MESLAETRLRQALARLGFDPGSLPTCAAITAATKNPLFAYDQKTAYHTVMDIVQARLPKPKPKRAYRSHKKRPVVCVTTGESFASISEAARRKGVEKANLRNSILRGHMLKGMAFKFAA